jgi:hypothetical protein
VTTTRTQPNGAASGVIGDGGRTIMRRRGLPSGRAVTGALLIALAAIGVFVAYRGANRPPSTDYVVVSHDVAAGQRLKPADLATRAIDLPDVVSRGAFTDPAQLIGQVTVAPFSAGELVQRSGIAAGGTPDAFEVPLALPAEEIVTGLERGDKVNVLVTYDENGGFTSEAVLDALVVDVGSSGDSLSTAGKRTIVLALKSRDDVLSVTHGLRAGQITLVRSTLADEGDEPPSSFTPPVQGAGPTGHGSTTTTTAG